MEQVKEILSSQQEIGKQITKLCENFNKEGRVRRNKVERLNKWRTDFNDEWLKFLANHDLLTEKQVELQDEAYFKEDYYNFSSLNSFLMM